MILIALVGLHPSLPLCWLLTQECTNESTFNLLANNMEKTFLFRLKNAKLRSELSTLVFFCEQMQYPRKQSFHIPKYSIKIWCTLSTEHDVSYPTHFHFKVVQNDFVNFFIFHRITAEFGHPGHSAQFVFVQPPLNPANQRQMIAFDGTDSLLHFSSHSRVFKVYFSIK